MTLLLADIQPIALILHKYQAQGILKPDFTLVLVTELIAPFFMQHSFAKALEGIDLPEIDLDRRAETFLSGFGTSGD